MVAVIETDNDLRHMQLFLRSTTTDFVVVFVKNFTY